MPDRGIIDPEQAREVEGLDAQLRGRASRRAEVSIRPAPADWNLSTVTVQQDGVIDLGFLGDVYVTA